MFAAVDCKTTNIERRSRKAQAGLGILELVISLGLGAVASTAVLILAVHTSRSLADMVNYVDLDHANRIALDTMTREIRQATALTSFSSTQLVFNDKDGQPLRYEYSPTDRVLKRAKGTEPEQILLTECDKLSFGMYQRTPQYKDYNLFTASSASICKVVTITWSCSRSIFGAKVNTEQGQTAKIVIRNKKEP